jgi:hypothetical protein
MRCSASVGWARGGQEGHAGRTRALSGPTHFKPKSEAEIGAHGQARTALSVWVRPLGCGFLIFLSVRTRSNAGWSFRSARLRCPNWPWSVDVFFGSIPRCRHAALWPSSHLVCWTVQKKSVLAPVRGVRRQRAAHAAPLRSSSNAVLGLSSGRGLLPNTQRASPAVTWTRGCAWRTCEARLHLCVVLHVRTEPAARTNVTLTLYPSRAMATTTSFHMLANQQNGLRLIVRARWGKRA